MKKILLTFVGMALSALPFSTSAFAQTKATADEAVVKAVTQAAQTPYPFELSTAPQGDSWDSNTKWYTLKLSNKYLTHVSGQSYIPLSSTVDTKNENSLWAFVEENGKIKIYNAGAGVGMVLAAPSNVQFSGSTYATMTSTTALSGKTAAWEFSAGSGNGAFFLKLDGTQNAYMNDFAGNGKVAFWSGADAGSTFSVSPVESLPVLDVQYSDAPTESGFAPNTKWHTLTIRDYFICYDVDHDYMNLNTKQNPNNYGSYWAFVKKQTENGTEVVEIYNAGAGPNKVLSSVVPPSGQDKTTFPHMADKNAGNSSLTQSWDLKKNNTPHVLFLKLHGTASAYLNYRDAKLAYWDNSSALGDNGSTVRAVQFTDADIQAQNTKAKDCFTQAPIGCVGGLATDTEKQKVMTELNKSTLEGYAAGMSSVAQSCVKLDTNKCYRLQSYYSKYMTMAMNGNSVSAKGKDLNNADVAQVWTFTPDGNGYKIGAQHRFLKAVTQSTQVPTTDETDPTTGAAKYHLMTMSPTKFAIDADGGNASTKDKLHEDASHNIVGWGSDADASQWYLMPATTIEVSVSAAGYTTVNYPFAVQLPETGLQAFVGRVAQSKGQDVFVLRELRDKKIPANTPMILAGAQGSYTLTILDKNVQIDAVAENPLKGTYMQKTMSNGVVTYVLSKPSSFEVGFYKLEDTEDMQNGATPNRLIPSNKAYLPGSSLSQTTAQTYGFAFSLDENGGGTTGIEEETVTDLSKEEFFDLQGRRVMKPSKGIFVTKSGKKVLFF